MPPFFKNITLEGFIAGAVIGLLVGALIARTL